MSNQRGGNETRKDGEEGGESDSGRTRFTSVERMRGGVRTRKELNKCLPAEICVLIFETRGISAHRKMISYVYSPLSPRLFTPRSSISLSFSLSFFLSRAHTLHINPGRVELIRHDVSERDGNCSLRVDECELDPVEEISYSLIRHGAIGYAMTCTPSDVEIDDGDSKLTR